MLPASIHGKISGAMKIVPTGPTIKEMKREAEQCEQAARLESGTIAEMLQERAALLREWIRALRSGKWTS
jgi:hypothetical protein